MNEELFIYPAESENTFLKYKMLCKKRRKTLLIMLISLLIAVVSLCLSNVYDVSFLYYIALVFFLLSAVSIYDAKGQYKSQLEIRAYNDHIELDYYSVGVSPMCKSVNAKYDDIVEGYLQENFTQVMLVFKAGSSCVTGKNSDGKEIDCENKFVRFQLNEHTPEQAFFIYTAPQLFPMRFNKKKALGKFGDESDYYNTYCS